MALPNRLIDFEIVGAGVEGANGRYFVYCWGANSRPEYYNSSNREFRIKWSEEDLAWTLQHNSGIILFIILDSKELEFPCNAKWSTYVVDGSRQIQSEVISFFCIFLARRIGRW